MKAHAVRLGLDLGRLDGPIADAAAEPVFKPDVKHLREAGTAIGTTYNKDGWAVSVGRRPYTTDNRGPLVPYDPDLLDFFFILDGDLTMYVIPSQVIAGRVGLLLTNYSKYIVGSAAFLMKCSSPAA